MDFHLAVRVLGIAIIAFLIGRFLWRRLLGPRDNPYALDRLSREAFEPETMPEAGPEAGQGTTPNTTSVPATDGSGRDDYAVAVWSEADTASDDLVFFDYIVQAPLAKTWRAMEDLSLLPFVSRVGVVADGAEFSTQSGDVPFTSDNMREGVLVRLSGSFLLVLIRFSAVARLTEVSPQHRLALDFPRQEPEFLVTGNRPVEGQMEFNGRAVFELAPQGNKTLLRVALVGAYFTDNGDTFIASEDLGRQYRSYFKRYAKFLAKRAKRY